MTVETLLSRLDMVKPAGTDRWYARCPAHQDKSPSLSIRDTGTRTLIHCFAGCDAGDVLAAVGLTWRDIIRDEWKAAQHAAEHHRVKLPPLDPLALERRIIEIGLADLEAGKTLSTEDQARYELALMRVKGAA
ncbi:MAG: hypothetical protein KDE45_00315 [Caldilineaceae bacterium]|nr:hypothetical protein [Caldilineaceae bacterium]